MAVRRPLLRERRRLRGGEVFEPLGRFPRRPRADVDREERLGADLVEEVHELVRPETVRLGHAAPVRIERDGARAGRSDAVAPVVFVGEAAAGPANVGDLERLERGHDVVADAAGIWDGGRGADPDALVHAVAEVFGELAEDVAVDLRAGFGRVHGQLDRLVRERNPGPARADQNQADDEQANGGRESEDHVCFSEYVT